jgi:hypothetical protein
VSIKFDDMFTLESWYNGQDYLCLKCAGCKGSYTHHDKVEVFNRAEDASTGTHGVVDGENVTKDSDISRNPSDRREGILIHYWCENCEARSVLKVAQHKGITWMHTSTLAEHLMRSVL